MIPGKRVATTLYPYATPDPRAIRVNMLRFRLLTEAQPRSKNGLPPQTTTGVARRSCAQRSARPERAGSGDRPRIISAIARIRSGVVSAREIQNRRPMSASSGFASSSPVITSGSRAIPQIGQLPGPILRISGCIGQV